MTLRTVKTGWEWQSIPVILVLGKLWQEDQVHSHSWLWSEFLSTLGHTIHSLKNTKQNCGVHGLWVALPGFLGTPLFYSANCPSGRIVSLKCSGESYPVSRKLVVGRESLPVLLSVEELYGGAHSGFYVCACELGWSVLA